jgi:molybdate transport system substrate-binding protein
MRVPNTRMLAGLAVTLLLMSGVAPARAEELVLYGAGSLREVMTDFTKSTGIPVRTSFGPSGLMRGKIEAGDKVDLFASADMGHPVKLQKDGRATSVVMFTRNRLCAFAKPDAGLTTANFAERLVDTAVKLGTSTPVADPAGDYTWQMFRLIDKARPGAFATLDAKAKKVDGGPPSNPPDPDPTGSAFARGEINVMIAYCSGVERRQHATPDAQVVHVPDSLAVGPEYGLAILDAAPPAAARLAFAILSVEGQATLARFGFDPVGLPSGR